MTRTSKLILLASVLLLSACGQQTIQTPSGPVTLSLRASLPGPVTAQGLPTGALPALHFNVTVRDAAGTVLTFNDGVYEPGGQGSQRTVVLNRDDQYATTLALPAGTYSFETAAKDGVAGDASTGVLLAYGTAAENTVTLKGASHTARLKFHTVLDPQQSRLGLKAGAPDPAADTPVDLRLQPMTAPVNGTAYLVPTTDYSTPTYTLADGSQSVLNGKGSVLGVNVTPRDATLNVTATFQAWLRQGTSDTAVLKAVTLTAQQAVTGINACGTRVNLAVGQVATYSGADAAKLCLTGGDAGQEYTAIPFNASDVMSYSTTTPLTFNASNIVAPTLAQLSTAPASPSLGTDTPPAPSGQTPPSEHLNALLQSPDSRIQTQKLRALSIPAGSVPAVESLLTLNAAQSCQGPADNRLARVESISARAIVVQEVMESSPGSGTYIPVVAGGFSRTDYDYIGKNFDVIYDEVTRNFGTPTDLDTNSHVVLFFTKKVNELSAPGTSAVTYGNFLTKDLFSLNACGSSNEGELLNLMMPDPTGAVNSNVRSVALVAGNINPTLARELTRLVNASRRAYVSGATAFEDEWLDQGLATASLELMFYRALTDTMYSYSNGTWTASTPCTALAPRQNIILTDLTSGTCASRRVAAFNTYQNQIFTLYRTYLQHPTNNSIYLRATTATSGNTGQGTTYSATAAFLRYAADRRGGTEADFWKSLVDSPLTGLANLGQATGSDPKSWLRDWSIANYLDDKSGVTGVSVVHRQPSWNYRSVFGGLGGFPLQPRALTNGADLTLSFHSGAAAYLALGVAAGQDATLTVQSSGNTVPANMSVSVVRVK